MRLAVLAALLLAATPAQARWREASSPHFVIYSEDSPKNLEEFATKLEKFDRAMRVIRGLDDPPISPGNRLTVFVVPSIAAVQKLYGRGGGDIGGFYIGRATGSIAITPRFGEAEHTLLHEYAHHFMMQVDSAAFPAWFVEGFAEMNGTARFDKDGSVGIGVPATHRAYGLFQGAELPLERMMSSAVGDLKPEEREKIYGRGWLLTHYLMFEPGRSGQLKKYIQEINKGKPSLEAATASFGDLKALDRELDKYLLKPRMTYLKLPAEKVQIGKIAVRELSAAEDSVMDVRIRSKRGVDDAAAKALVPLARKAASPYPEDPFAQVTLAEVEFDAGNYAEAEAAADRALKADPKSVEGLIYKGRAKMALASEASSKDPAVWKDVRKWFVAANRVDADDPEPLMLFYTSFMSEGRPPTANAAIGLVRALELAPQDEGLRWMVAHQHLRDKKAADARAALAPLAFDPHGGKGGQMAASLIAKLDGAGVEEALKVWESMQDEAKSEKAD